MTKIKKLIEEYEFNGLRIKLYDEDFEHALSAHPGEVTLDAIRNCIRQPDLVIRSVQGKNACLFYEMKIQDEYFVVVVHVTESGTGEVKTAYKTTYIKNGTVLFKKKRKIMNLKYMAEIDTLYIYFESETPKIMVPSNIDKRVGRFVDKKNRKIICGYEIEGASDFFLENINKFDFNLKQLIAAGIFFIRVLNGYSQEKMATELGVSLSSYKMVEKAEQNFTIDTFESINSKFPKMKKIVAESLLAS